MLDWYICLVQVFNINELMCMKMEQKGEDREKMPRLCCHGLPRGACHDVAAGAPPEKTRKKEESAFWPHGVHHGGMASAISFKKPKKASLSQVPSLSPDGVCHGPWRPPWTLNDEKLQQSHI